MRDIYNQASSVIAWLGKEDEQMDEAMDAACLIHRYYLQNALDEPRLQRPEELSCRYRVHYREVPTSQPTETAWEKAAKLLTRSYFTRLWIVQELVVAHRAQITCGAFSMDFRCLRGLMVAGFEHTKKLQGTGPIFRDHYLGGQASAVLSLQ